MNNSNVKCRCGTSDPCVDTLAGLGSVCHECYVKYGMTDDERECYYNQPSFNAEITSYNIEMIENDISFTENSLSDFHCDLSSPLLSRRDIEASLKLRGQAQNTLALLAVAVFSIIGSVAFIHSAFAYESPMERCQQVYSFDTCFSALHR